MIESGPVMIVYGPSITRTRLELIAFVLEIIIDASELIVSCPQIIIFGTEIIICVGAVGNPLIREDLRCAGDNYLRYGDYYLGVENDYLRLRNDRRCSINDHVR